MVKTVDINVAPLNNVAIDRGYVPVLRPGYGRSIATQIDHPDIRVLRPRNKLGLYECNHITFLYKVHPQGSRDIST
jgi:hypothetical protein